MDTKALDKELYAPIHSSKRQKQKENLLSAIIERISSFQQQYLGHNKQGKKKHSLKVQSNHPHPDMTQIIETIKQIIKKKDNNRLKALMGKVENVQGQSGNFSKEMETIRQKQRKVS